MSAQAETRLRPNPEVIGQRLGEELVLIHLRTNRMYELNLTAARIWELLDEARDLPQIRECLLEEFDLDGADLESDVADLLSQLDAEKLIIAS